MPRPSERLKNMKRPAAAAQGAIPKGPHPKRSQPAAKLQTMKTFKLLASKLAGFKLPKSTDTKSTDMKSIGKSINKSAINKSISASGEPAALNKTALNDESAVSFTNSETASGKTTSASSSAPIPGLPFIKDSKGSRIAFNLLLVRPWVLVVGFWLFSLVGASFAFEGLVNPRKLQAALPEATVEVAPVPARSALIQIVPDDTETAATTTQSGETAGSAASAAANTDSTAKAQQGAAAQSSVDGRFPIWTLSALVGTCAVGCLVISRRRAMVRLAMVRSRRKIRRTYAHGKVLAKANGMATSDKSGSNLAARKAVKANPSRPLGVKSAVATSSPAAQPVGVLAGVTLARTLLGRPTAQADKKRRQRNKQSVVSQPVGQPVGQPTAQSGDRVVISRSTAQQAAQKAVPNAASKTASGTAAKRPVRRTPSRIASRHQSVVSVMPASESHALDWAEGSLAHQMDVRPQRTASM